MCSFCQVSTSEDNFIQINYFLSEANSNTYCLSKIVLDLIALMLGRSEINFSAWNNLWLDYLLNHFPLQMMISHQQPYKNLHIFANI